MSDSTSTIQQLEKLFELLGRSVGDTIYVRGFAPKGFTDEQLLSRELAYKKGQNVHGKRFTGEIKWSSPGTFTSKQTTPWVEGHESAIAFLDKKNDEGFGVYFTVNPGGQKDKEITSAPALFYEIDDISKTEQWAKVRELESELGEQLLVVETHKSLHVYLLLESAIDDLPNWRKFQQRLIEKMGADPANHNPSRVMRLPGFDHVRGGNEGRELLRSPVKVAQWPSDRLPLKTIEAALPAWEETQWAKKKQQQRKYVQPAGVTTDYTNQEIADGYDIRNFAHHLLGYNPEGRPGWATAQCPLSNHHGGSAGRKGGHSFDSLHINNGTGAFTCHSGCCSKDVYQATLELAKSNGYEPLKKSLEPLAQKKGRKSTVKCAIARKQNVIVFSHALAEDYRSKGYTVGCFPHPYDLVKGKKPNRELVPELKAKVEPRLQWIIDPGLGEEHEDIESYRFDSTAAGIIGELIEEAGGDVLGVHPQDRSQLLPIEDFKTFSTEWYGGKSYQQLTAKNQGVEQLNTRYLSDELPAISRHLDNGKITILSSQTNTGKTFAVQKISKEFANVVAFNPLVSLTEQTSKEFGIDAKPNQGASSSSVQPINSTWKFAQQAPPSDKPLLAYFDEITDCIDILASGSQLGKKHGDCIQGFLNVIYAAVGSGGAVITSQQTIPSRVPEWIEAVTGLEVQFINNEYKQREGKVKIVEATNPLQATVDELQGCTEPTVVACSAQKSAERLYWMLGEDKAVLVDAKTKQNHKELFGGNASGYLKWITQSGKHLIYTPVLGTGISLRFKDAGFSRMISVITCGTLESNIQLNRRDRSGLPLTVYTMRNVLNGKRAEYSWQSIAKNKNKAWQGTIKAVGFLTVSK